MTLVNMLFKGRTVVILVNNMNLGSEIPSLVLLNFWMHCQLVKWHAPMLFCLGLYLDLYGLLSSQDPLSANDGGHHVRVSFFTIQSLRCHQEPGITQNKLVASFIIGYQMSWHCSFSFVLVNEDTEISNYSSYKNIVTLRRNVVVRDKDQRFFTDPEDLECYHYLPHSPARSTPELLANHWVCQQTAQWWHHLEHLWWCG